MCNVDCVSINYVVFENGKDCNVKTVSDIYLHSKYKGEILYIKNFVVDSHYRGKRLGGKELYKLLEKHEDKLIVIELFYIPLELHEVIDSKERRKRLIKLGKYFLKIGFQDINKYFGRHSDKISMCFKNSSYKNWLKS